MSAKEKLEIPLTMGFLDHLEELRWRLVKAILAIFIFAIAAFFFINPVIRFLIEPAVSLSEPLKLQVLKVQGMFVIQIMVSIAVGFILAIPVWVWQLWQFIGPGLKPEEQKYAIPVILVTFLNFLLGTAFAYFLVLPVALEFLLGINFPEDIVPNVALDQYINFVVLLMLGMGTIFELPVLTFILTRFRLISYRLMIKIRRYAVVAIFIIAAFLTPPDPFSQIMMAVPVIFLYELSVWISKWAEPD
jgi:sec-independent protein translocase protein TatC